MESLRDFQKSLEAESDALFGERWRAGSRLYWATALAGEVGELCNLAKKEARDGVNLTADIGGELADVIITASLMASVLGLDLKEVVAGKRKVVQERAKAQTERTPSALSAVDGR